MEDIEKCELGKTIVKLLGSSVGEDIRVGWELFRNNEKKWTPMEGWEMVLLTLGDSYRSNIDNNTITDLCTSFIREGLGHDWRNHPIYIHCNKLYREKREKRRQENENLQRKSNKNGPQAPGEQHT